MKKVALIAASAIGFFAVEAYAQMGGGGGERAQRPEFSELDTDENGLLSVEELNEFNADRAEGIMTRMDADEDGSLTEEEWNTRPERGQGGGMGGQ